MKANNRGKHGHTPTLKQLPDWNNHPSVSAAWCQCPFIWDSKLSANTNLAATHSKFFSSPSIISTHVICDVYWSGHSLPLRLAPERLKQISVWNSDLLLPKTGSQAPSLQLFCRGRWYWLKQKHSQLPYQFSHRHPAPLTGHLEPNSSSTKLMHLHKSEQLSCSDATQALNGASAPTYHLFKGSTES